MVYPSVQFILDALQCARNQLRYRLPTQTKLSTPTGPAIMREPEKIEGFRSLQTTFSTIRCGKSSKLNKTSLVWM